MAELRKQEIFSENKRKEKLSSLRDFKIHSNTLSPNTSTVRGKNILRDTYLDAGKGRQDIFGNHSHFKRPPGNEVAERHSYNYSDSRKRQPSESNQRHKTPNSTNLTGRTNPKPVSYEMHPPKPQMTSNAKQKIKNLLTSGTQAFSIGTDSYNQDQKSDNRKTAKLITTNSNDAAAKKLHKKSNSMKNDLLQKYYGKHTASNSVDYSNNPNNNSQ
jgi:hypothetical protein